MSKIPKSVIKEINRKTDIVELVEEFANLKPKGSNLYTCQCMLPEHDEKNNSFTVYEHTNSWWCFGCKRGSTPIDFIVEVKGWPFVKAAKYLAKRLGICIDSESDKYQEIYKEHELQQQTYLENRNNKYATYLQERGIMPEAAKLWGIGYDKNCITFPFYDQDNNILGFSKRFIKTSKDGSKYIHPANSAWYSKRNYLYGIHTYKRNKEPYIFFVEGVFDAILPQQYGLQNVFCTLGTNFFETYVEFIKRTKKIPVLMYDNDEAGQRAILEVCEWLEREHLNPHVVFLEEGKDVADMVLEYKGDFIEYVYSNICSYSYFLIKKEINLYQQKLFHLQETFYKNTLEKMHTLNEKDRSFLYAYIREHTGLLINHKKQMRYTENDNV